MTDQPNLEPIEHRLRQLIHWRDFLAAEMAVVDGYIATEARALCDATGVKVRPTIDQLRRQLVTEYKAA